MPYKQDIWMPAITVTTSNNSFRLVEDPGGTPTVLTVTIAAGTYYAHADTTITALPLLGLFDALATALNDEPGSDNTYTFTTIAPTQSSGFALAGIRLTGVLGGSAVDFEIDFSHGSFTMDPAWFGFRLATATQTTFGQLTWAGGNVLASTTASGDEIITSDYTSSVRWYSKTYGALTNGASDKRAMRYGNRKYSSSRLTDAVSVEWDSGRTRNFRYEWVPSQHLLATRGDVAVASEWTVASDLDGFDRYQGFDQYVWEPMAQLTPVLVQHDVTTAALADVSAHSYELVRLLNEGQAQRFDSVVSLRRQGGEFYDLELEVQIDPTYDSAGH